MYSMCNHFLINSIERSDSHFITGKLSNSNTYCFLLIKFNHEYTLYGYVYFHNTVIQFQSPQKTELIRYKMSTSFTFQMLGGLHEAFMVSTMVRTMVGTHWRHWHSQWFEKKKTSDREDGWGRVWVSPCIDTTCWFCARLEIQMWQNKQIQWTV